MNLAFFGQYLLGKGIINGNWIIFSMNLQPIGVSLFTKEKSLHIVARFLWATSSADATITGPIPITNMQLG